METNVVFDFTDAISNADVDRIYSLMTQDHLFIDSQGNKMEGRENMKQAWTAYFGLFPDYKIEIECLFQPKSIPVVHSKSIPFLINKKAVLL